MVTFRHAFLTMLMSGTLLFAEERQLEITVPAMDVSELEVELSISKSNLVVSAGTTDLLRGLFTTQDETERPKLTFKVDGSEAKVGLSGAESADLWEIYLTDQVPSELKIKSRIGNQRVILDGLQAESVKIDSVTGNTAIQAGGDQSLLKEISVEQHVGNCEIELTGTFQKMEEFDVEVGNGEVSLNLRGSWDAECEGEIELESGNCSIILPTSTGAIIRAKADKGEVVVNGLSEHSPGAYVNSAYEKTAHTLKLDVHVKKGNIFLRGA